MFQIFLQLFCFTHTTYTPQSHSSQIYTHLEAVGFRWRPAVSFYITWNPMLKSIENWSIHCRYVMKELSYIINIVDFTYKGHNQSFIAFPLGRRTLFLHFISSRKRQRLQIRLESLCIEKKMSKKIRGQRLRVHPSNPWVFFDLRSVAAGSQDELQQGLSMRVWG